jgi:hypothetical protein
MRVEASPNKCRSRRARPTIHNACSYIFPKTKPLTPNLCREADFVVHTWAGIGSLPRKPNVKYQQPNIHPRQTARESRLQTAKSVRNGAQDSGKSVFSTRTQFKTLKTKLAPHENGLGDTRNESNCHWSVASNLQARKNKKNSQNEVNRTSENYGRLPSDFSSLRKRFIPKRTPQVKENK